MQQRTFFLFVSLLLAPALWAVAGTGLNLNVRFSQIDGLQPDARVLFEQNPIGAVTGVSYGKDGVYTAAISIPQPFANAATEYSRFFIVDDPKQNDRKAVEIVLLQPGGTPLQDGATVVGSASGSALFEKLEADIQKGIEYLGKELDRYKEDLRRIPATKEYRELKRELSELAEELSRSSEKARKQIQEDLMPLMKQELELFKEKLREYRKEAPPAPKVEQL